MPLIDGYPAIAGAFLKIDVEVSVYIPPLEAYHSIDEDTSNAKLLVFQTSEYIYHIFIIGGPENKQLLTGCSTESWTMRQLNENALVWYLCYLKLVMFRVGFTDRAASEKFSNLVNLWERSKTRNGDVRVDKAVEDSLQEHVKYIANHQWANEEEAFEDIDMLTSSMPF